MQNSRLFSRLFPKTIIYFSTLKVIRKVITLKKAGTSSWRARLNKIWQKPEKNFTHIALIVALKKKSRPFTIFSRLFLLWAQKWQMKFNPSKCHVLRISRKQNPVESNYVLMRKVLDSVTHHRYLGVELSRNLEWGKHVNNKVMKANRSLGFLRRNLSSCPEGVKEAAYKALVRPHVEYVSSVWDPHLKKHVKQIEGVQRRAARFVLKTVTRGNQEQLETSWTN